MPNKLPKLLSDVESSALFDLDLTAGSGALPSGWAVVGSGETWDTEYGFNGNGTAYIRTDNFSARNALLSANSGYIYLEFERDAICTDKTYSSGSTFYDSDGNTNVSTDKSLLWADDGAGGDDIRMYRFAASYIFVLKEAGTTKYSANLISRRSSKQDQRFGYLIFTWSGTSATVIIDGNVAKQYTRSANISSFKRLYIGAYAGASFLGAYYVRRIMCGTQYIVPTTDSMRVAVIGDSFVTSGSDRGEPADTDNTTVSELDGLQVSTEIGSAMFGKLDNYRGLSPFVFQTQANHFNRFGTFLSVYNAGNSGNGWRTDVSSSLQIKPEYKAAASAFNPRIVIMVGSVNDLTETVNSFDVEADFKSHIDDMLDASSAIKRIYLIQTFGWHNALNASADSAAWITNYNRYVAQMSRLDGYRGKVVFVPNLWGSTPPDAYTWGAHPDNSTTSSGTDFHPSATGHTKIADTISAIIDAEKTVPYRSSLIPSLIGSVVSTG